MEHTVNIISKVGIAILIAAVLGSIYIMKNNLGMIEGLDFGCGQYYYTDVPNWQFIFSGRGYKADGHMGLYIGGFFLWGALMYKLWVYLDKK
nr:hypothetical protein [uncultured Cellulosilyticum sp.]